MKPFNSKASREMFGALRSRPYALAFLLASLLIGCGGSEASDPNESRVQHLPDLAQEEADSNSTGGEAPERVVTPGVILNPAADDTTAESFDEGAKSFRPEKTLSGASRQVVVIRDVANAPEPSIVVLDTATEAEQAVMQQSLVSSDGDGSSKLKRTGFGRRVPIKSVASDGSTGISASAATVAKASWNWTEDDDGRKRAAVGVRSPNAKGLRVALQIGSLPDGALLRFYSPGSSTMVQLHASEVLSVLAAKAADPDAQGKSLFWTSVTPGDTSIVEVALAPGSSVSDFDVRIDQVVHMVVSQQDAGSKAVFNYDGIDYSGACQQDAVCTFGNNSTAADATLQLSLLEYDRFGLAGSYMCTGTLVGDNAGSGIPYVLTADHCVANQAQASDMLATAYFRSSACNASTLDGRAVDFWGRWEYLYSERKSYVGTDIALLRMNLWEALPTDILLAGWDASYVSSGESIKSFHHPSGSLLKFSEGAAYWHNRSYLKVYWTGQGTTEGGSSGSSLLNPEDQVIGTLWGGYSACATSASGVATLTYGNGKQDYYGRLSAAYARGMRRWLNIDAQSVWASADMDGDGNRELLFAATRNGGLGLNAYLSAEIDSSTGQVSGWKVLDAGLAMTDEYPDALAVMDMNGDGRDDILFRAKDSDGTYSLRMLTLREQEVDGVTTLVAHAPTLMSRLHKQIVVVGVGRLDSDQYADLILWDSGKREKVLVTALITADPDAQGEYLANRMATTLDYSYFNVLGVGNFTGDDRVEILLYHYKYKNYAVVLGWDEAGKKYDIDGLTPGSLDSAPGRVVALADINGDGYTDIIRDYYRYLTYMTSGVESGAYRLTRTTTVVPRRPSWGALVTASDLDGDGIDDLVWRHAKDGRIWIMRSPASGSEVGELQELNVKANAS